MFYREGFQLAWDARGDVRAAWRWLERMKGRALTFCQPGGFRMLMEDLGEDGLRQWHRFAPLLDPVADWAAPDDVVYLVPHGLLPERGPRDGPAGRVRAPGETPTSRRGHVWHCSLSINAEEGQLGNAVIAL